MRGSCRLDLDSTSRSLTTEEDCLVGHEGRACRSYFGLLAKESSLITTVTLSLHIGGNDAVLHVLELLADGVLSVHFSLVATIEELASVSIVLTGCVRHLILEESLLGKLEARVLAHFLGHIPERILYTTSGPTRLLELAVLNLGGLLIVINSIELGIRLH